MIITIDKKEYQTPDTWNDCTLEQALYCYSIIMTDLGHQFEPFEVLPAKRIAITKYLLGIDMKDWETWEVLELSTAVTSFLFEQEKTEEGKPEQFTIALNLTKNPYPYFQFKKKRYHSPTDVLDNLTIYELGTTFTIFEAYLNTQDETLLHKLLAILYRPEKPKTKYNKERNYEGDRRLPYLGFEATVPGRQKRMKLLPPAVKAIVLFWFASCRQHIINDYENIFVQPVQGKQVGNDYGWGGVLMSLADGLVHLDAVSKQNYKNAFARLSYLEDERKKMELKSLKS